MFQLRRTLRVIDSYLCPMMFCLEKNLNVQKALTEFITTYCCYIFPTEMPLLSAYLEIQMWHSRVNKLVTHRYIVCYYATILLLYKRWFINVVHWNRWYYITRTVHQSIWYMYSSTLDDIRMMNVPIYITLARCNKQFLVQYKYKL